MLELWSSCGQRACHCCGCPSWPLGSAPLQKTSRSVKRQGERESSSSSLHPRGFRFLWAGRADARKRGAGEVEVQRGEGRSVGATCCKLMLVEGTRRIQNGILLVKVNHTDVVVYTSHKAEVTKKGLCQNRAAGIEPTTCWESSSKKKKSSKAASTERCSAGIFCLSARWRRGEGSSVRACTTHTDMNCLKMMHLHVR